MNATINLPAKPTAKRQYVAQTTTARIHVGAKIERLSHGYDAYMVTADLKTGEYTKRGRIFMDRDEAQKWLAKQTVAI